MLIIKENVSNVDGIVTVSGHTKEHCGECVIILLNSASNHLAGDGVNVNLAVVLQGGLSIARWLGSNKGFAPDELGADSKKAVVVVFHELFTFLWSLRAVSWPLDLVRMPMSGGPWRWGSKEGMGVPKELMSDERGDVVWRSGR